MKIPYYPGCTLHERARDFDVSAKECARALGVELEELPIWTCCGAVYPLVTDSVMDVLAGVPRPGICSGSRESPGLRGTQTRPPSPRARVPS